MGLLTDRNKEMRSAASVLWRLKQYEGVTIDRAAIMSPDQERSKKEYIRDSLESISGQIIDSLPYIEELSMLLSKASAINAPFDRTTCYNQGSQSFQRTYTMVYNSIYLNYPHTSPAESEPGQNPLNDWHARISDMMQDINKNRTWRTFFSLPRHAYIGVSGLNITRTFRQDMISSRIISVFYMYIQFAKYGLGNSLDTYFDSRCSMFMLNYEYIPGLWGF